MYTGPNLLLCGVVLGWNPRPHLFPPPNLQSPAHCDRGGRQTLRETILLWITSQHTDTNKRLWWAVIWFLSTVFSFLLQIPRLRSSATSSILFVFCRRAGSMIYPERSTSPSLYIYSMCVYPFIFIYIYIYVYNTERDRRARKGRDTLDMFRLLLLLSICALLCGQPLIVVV